MTPKLARGELTTQSFVRTGSSAHFQDLDQEMYPVHQPNWPQSGTLERSSYRPMAQSTMVPVHTTLDMVPPTQVAVKVRMAK